MEDKELDKAIRAKKRELTGLGSGDHDVFHSASSGEGLIALNGKMLQGLAKAATERHSIFQEVCEAMRLEQAEFARSLRVDKGYSWRAVAEACYDQEWANFNREEWMPPSNQLMGMALCEKAAEMFGENYMQEPWN